MNDWSVKINKQYMYMCMLVTSQCCEDIESELKNFNLVITIHIHFVHVNYIVHVGMFLRNQSWLPSYSGYKAVEVKSHLVAMEIILK